MSVTNQFILKTFRLWHSN